VERFSWIRSVIHKLANSYHVDHGSRLIGISWVNCVVVGDMTTLGMVFEEMVDGVLVHRSHAFQPEKGGASVGSLFGPRNLPGAILWLEVVDVVWCALLELS
jgi:hypothetical protein